MSGMHPSRSLICCGDLLLFTHPRTALTQAHHRHTLALLATGEQPESSALLARRTLTAQQLLPSLRESGMALLDPATLKPISQLNLPRWLTLSPLVIALPSPRPEQLIGLSSRHDLILINLDDHSLKYRPTPLSGELRHAALSADGRWLALVASDSRRATFALYALHPDTPPTLHLEALERRHVVSPASWHAAPCDLSLCFSPDGDTLFVLMSHHLASSAPWEGWRGSIAAHDTRSGKLLWSAELDAETTADPRRASDMRQAPFAPALCCTDNDTLWVGGWDSSLLQLDARDGALRQLEAHGGAHGTLAICHDPEHESLFLLDESGRLSRRSLQDR